MNDNLIKRDRTFNITTYFADGTNSTQRLGYFVQAITQKMRNSVQIAKQNARNGGAVKIEVREYATLYRRGEYGELIPDRNYATLFMVLERKGQRWLKVA